MMFDPENSVLVVVDIQGNLAQLMDDKDQLFSNTQILIQAAQSLDIPVIVTEQVPEKLGQTIPEIAYHVDTSTIVEKESFSCCGSFEFLQSLNSTDRDQVIICGIEAHVCVFQTVADLLEHQIPVQVVVDAVSSRTSENRAIGLERMKAIGATLTSTEMVLTELLRTSTHPKFKEILKLIK